MSQLNGPPVANAAPTSCIFCVCTIEQNQLPTINSCEHQKFCFNCIGRWAKRTNACPFCKKKFSKINDVEVEDRGAPIDNQEDDDDDDEEEEVDDGAGDEDEYEDEYDLRRRYTMSEEEWEALEVERQFAEYYDHKRRQYEEEKRQDLEDD